VRGVHTIVSRQASFLLLLAAFVSTAAALDAQSFVGVTAATGSTTLNGDRLQRAVVSGRASFAARLVGGLDVGDGVYLVAMPGWATRGGNVERHEAPPALGVSYSELAIQYVSLPIGLRVRARNEHIYVTSMIDLARVTSATLSTIALTPFALPDVTPETEDVLQNLNPWDVSIVLTAGALIPIGGPRLSVEIGWGQSLLNVTKEDFLPVDWALPPRFKFSGFSLRLGVQHDLGGGADR